MPKRVQPLVAVFYEHPLLGEGIARILLVETDAEVVAAPAWDRCTVEAVLARGPVVVVFEAGRCETQWRRLAPDAVLVDVTSAMSTRRDDSIPTVDASMIILAVRRGTAAPRAAATGSAATGSATQSRS